MMNIINALSIFMGIFLFFFLAFGSGTQRGVNLVIVNYSQTVGCGQLLYLVFQFMYTIKIASIISICFFKGKIVEILKR